MQLPDHGGLLHEPPIQRPLPFNGQQVFFLHRMVGGDFFVAAAVGAKRLAERQVYIEADAVDVVLLRKFLHKQVLPGAGGQALVPKRNGRIAGITGQGPVVFAHQ